MNQILTDLKAAQRLINNITQQDLNTNKIWLSNLFCANGHLAQAIKQYEKNPEREYKEDENATIINQY